jgi:hypothetical protein
MRGNPTAPLLSIKGRIHRLSSPRHKQLRLSSRYQFLTHQCQSNATTVPLPAAALDNPSRVRIVRNATVTIPVLDKTVRILFFVKEICVLRVKREVIFQVRY